MLAAESGLRELAVEVEPKNEAVDGRKLEGPFDKLSRGVDMEGVAVDGRWLISAN